MGLAVMDAMLRLSGVRNPKLTATSAVGTIALTDQSQRHRHQVQHHHLLQLKALSFVRLLQILSSHTVHLNSTTKVGPSKVTVALQQKLHLIWLAGLLNLTLTSRTLRQESTPTSIPFHLALMLRATLEADTATAPKPMIIGAWKSTGLKAMATVAAPQRFAP